MFSFGDAKAPKRFVRHVAIVVGLNWICGWRGVVGAVADDGAGSSDDRELPAVAFPLVVLLYRSRCCLGASGDVAGVVECTIFLF